MKNNILEVLTALGIQTKNVGTAVMFAATWRGEKKASCKVISESRFVDYGESESKSFDTIDLIMKVLGLNFRDAKDYAGKATNSITVQQAVRVEPKTGEVGTAVKLKNITSNSLLLYCAGRGVSGKVAKAYLSQAYYSTTKNGKTLHFNNIAMINNSGGIELRGESFKGIKGTKDVTAFGNTKTPKRIYLFEGMFDFVSLIELTGANINTSKGSDFLYIILHGTNQINKAIAQISDIKGIEALNAFFDRDAAGRKCFEHLKAAYPLAEYKTDKAVEYYGQRAAKDLSKCNDLNDILIELLRKL